MLSVSCFPFCKLSNVEYYTPKQAKKARVFYEISRSLATIPLPLQSGRRIGSKDRESTRVEMNLRIHRIMFVMNICYTVATEGKCSRPFMVSLRFIVVIDCGLGLCDCRTVRELTQILDDAWAAKRLSGSACVATVQNQPVVGIFQKFLWNRVHE